MDNLDYLGYRFPERRDSARHRKSAIRAASRTHFALFIYLLLSTLTMIAIQVGLIIAFSPEKAFRILENPYVWWGLQVLAMYVISFPVYVLLTRGLQRPLYERQKLNPGEFTVTFFICTAAMIIGSTISNIINDAIIGNISMSG